MVDFKEIELTDRAWMEPLLKMENSRSADFSFNNFYLWKDSYRTLVAKFQDRLLSKVVIRCGELRYFYPAGEGDLKAAVQEMLSDAKRSGMDLMIWGITPKRKALLEELFPEQFHFRYTDFAFDYVYSSQKLSELAGKRLHAKRNHINQFLEAHPDFRFEPLDEGNLWECQKMSQAWAEEMLRLHGRTNPEEQLALKRAFQDFDYLGLDGGLLRVDGEVAAFTIGEKQNEDTYTVHFEKAFSSMRGAYPMINREFVRYVGQLYPEVIYINREDDMGMENLRKAKRSYYPDFMVEKYIASFLNGEGK